MKEIVEIIKKSKNIVISGHIYPDADALGSMLALANIITKATNNNVRLCMNHRLPEYINELNPNILIESEINDDIDLLIAVDTANIERLAVTEKMLHNAKFTINIDHHISNTRYFDINYIEDRAAAAEIIYSFIKEFNIDIDQNIAKYIYLGIINDTSNFKHSNVTSRTFEIASKLVETGINTNELYNILFTKSISKAKLFSRAINDAKIINGFIYYTIEDTKDYLPDDFEGIAEYMLGIKGIELSLFLRKLENGKYKGNLRSKYDIDVNKIAGIFGGGGHKKASGFVTDMAEDDIIRKVLDYYD